MRLLVLLLAILSLPSSSFANLVLTYPQARFPPLDFLPSDLTQLPCGVPKPTKPFYTTLHIGDTYNITWITPSLSNSTYRIKLIDSDGLTVEQLPDSMIDRKDRSSNQIISLKSPCEQCMLLVEQVLPNGKSFRTCADVNVVRTKATEEEKCSGRGSMMEKTTVCQCESGFTGSQCEHYAHCESNDDCLNGGMCVDQNDSLIKKKCFCSYGFFGQRCDQKFNSQNDYCFAYDELVSTDLPRFGMFNPRCYKRYDLSADDQLYSRRIDNEIEIIMDFETNSWLSLGWRPTELSTSCRLFPILEDTRGRSGNEMDEETRRQFVAKPVMPKNNGFTEMGLKSPLHAMDCIDMVMGLVRNGRLLISDYYSRDRSTPLEDYWYEGEMSLSAAYGTEVDGRTIIMFRREMREFEPTDHPLGPNDVFVVWAKGDNSLVGDEFHYHGTNRGVDRLKLSEAVNVTFEEPPKKIISNEVAFGIKNVIQDRLTPMSSRPVEPSTTTTTESPPTTTTPESLPIDSSATILNFLGLFIIPFIYFF